MSESDWPLKKLFSKKEFSVLGVGTHQKGHFCWDISRVIGTYYPEWSDEYECRVEKGDLKLKLTMINRNRFGAIAGIPIREFCGRGTLDLKLMANSLAEFDELLREHIELSKDIPAWQGCFENVALAPFYSSTIKHEDSKLVTESVLGKSPINYVYGNIDNLILGLIGGKYIGKLLPSGEVLEKTSYQRATVLTHSWKLLEKFKEQPSRWTRRRNRNRSNSLNEVIKNIKENL